MRPERVPLFGIESAFEQRSEDGGLDLAPGAFGRQEQQTQRVFVERERGRMFEETAVELEDATQREGVATLVHDAPERLHLRLEA